MTKKEHDKGSLISKGKTKRANALNAHSALVTYLNDNFSFSKDHIVDIFLKKPEPLKRIEFLMERD